MAIQVMERIGPVNMLFFKRMYLSTDADVTNMAIDGSSTPQKFIIAPSAGEIYIITQMILYVTDAGSFDSGYWGNGITLANGQDFKVKLDGVTSDLLDFPLKTSGDVSSVGFHISQNKWGSGNEFLAGMLQLNDIGKPLRLIGDDGDELQFIVNDDQTNLVAQYILCEGYHENVYH